MLDRMVAGEDRFMAEVGVGWGGSGGEVVKEIDRVRGGADGRRRS